MKLEGRKLSVWPLLAVLGAGIVGIGNVRAEETHAAFVAELARVYAETDIHRGKNSDFVQQEVRRYIRESAYLREYEARVAQKLGKSCTNLGLGELLDSLVTTPDEHRASMYLMTVQVRCSRRLPADRQLVGEAWAALERGRAERAERHQRYVEAERRLALEEEEARRARRRASSATPPGEAAPAPPTEVAAAEPKAPSTASAEAQQAVIPPAMAKPPESTAVAVAQADKEPAASPVPPPATSSPAIRIAGTYRCGIGQEQRILYLGDDGELVELISIGDTVLGYAGLYRLSGDRVTMRFASDNSWKIFAAKYEQRLTDDAAWKRSAIASQKVLEFRIGTAAPPGMLRMLSPRTKLLLSGDVSPARRPDCLKLEESDPLVRATAAHARYAMRYVDKVLDAPPESLDAATLSLPRQIESKKRKELEWFHRAPGILKMMATDRLLEELRKGTDENCEAPRAALETNAAAAMGVINQIGASDVAKTKPQEAEALAGRQLDPVFEEFIDAAGRLRCLMAESSAVGL